MPKIISHSVFENGTEYAFELDIETPLRSLLQVRNGEESFKTTLTAKSRPVPAPGVAPAPWTPISAEIKFRFTDKDDFAVISVEGEKVAEIPFKVLLNASAGAPDEDDGGFLEEVLKRADLADAGSLDAAIQALPTDPIVGCILKSGISATLRQTTLCYETTRREKGALAKAKATLRCLGQNVGTILGRMGGRTMLCIMTAGLG